MREGRASEKEARVIFRLRRYLSLDYLWMGVDRSFDIKQGEWYKGKIKACTVQFNHHGTPPLIALTHLFWDLLLLLSNSALVLNAWNELCRLHSFIEVSDVESKQRQGEDGSF